MPAAANTCACPGCLTHAQLLQAYYLCNQPGVWGNNYHSCTFTHPAHAPQVVTLPGYASRAPMLKVGSSVKGISNGVAEAAFDLTFQMNAPGTVQFLVMHSKVYARFMDTYVVFDNAVRLCRGGVCLLVCDTAVKTRLG